MSESLRTPHKHDHSHDHDHDHDHSHHDHGHDHDHSHHDHAQKLAPVKEHDHGGGSCCSGAAAPSLVTLTQTTSANARLSTFRIEAMDCPTEQTLIQNKLGKLAGVQQLEFNLINRILGVTHDLPST
eukprot:gene17632-22483_t